MVSLQPANQNEVPPSRVQQSGGQRAEPLRSPLAQGLAAADANGDVGTGGVAQAGHRLDTYDRWDRECGFGRGQGDPRCREVACCPCMLVQTFHLPGQERAGVQEPALPAPPVSAPVRDIRNPGGCREQGAVMQQDDRAEIEVVQFADDSAEAVDTIMRAAPSGGIEIHPDDIRQAGFVGQQLIRVGTRFGDQSYFLSRVGGDGADVRQMPDHITDAGQGLDDRDRLLERRPNRLGVGHRATVLRPMVFACNAVSW